MAGPDYWTAVISSLSALLGAGVGGLATFKATEKNATLAQQAEQRTWLRGRREKAYLSLLAARNRYTDSATKKGEKLGEWALFHGTAESAQREPFDHEEYEQAIRGGWDDVLGELANVELFGSTAAQTMVRDWVWNGLPVYMFAFESLVFPRLGKAADVLGKEESKYRDPFTALVRRELGVVD